MDSYVIYSFGIKVTYGRLILLLPDKNKDIEQLRTYGYIITHDEEPKPEPSDVVHPLRSLYKTISWRVVASLDTFFISWLVTGYFALASTIAGVEVITKMGLYYFHERAWLRVRIRNPFRPH